MHRSRRRIRPALETLDVRVLMAASTTGTPAAADSSTDAASSTTLTTMKPVYPSDLTLVPGSHPGANRFRVFTPADLQAYADAYLAFSVDPRYNAAYDFNGTGFIGQNDATPILRGLAASTPKMPLKVQLRLAPGQQLFTAHPSISGAATHLATVTVVGKTTPNSIIFFDAFANSRLGASGNFKFQGGALVSDASGRFTYTFPLTPLSKNSLTTLNLLIRTPFNQQTVLAFPILRVGK